MFNSVASIANVTIKELCIRTVAVLYGRIMHGASMEVYCRNAPEYTIAYPVFPFVLILGFQEAGQEDRPEHPQVLLSEHSEYDH